jgi:hypothetical protein
MFKLFGVIAKVVKIWSMCESFCYGYGNNLYNPLFVFSVFGFRRRLTNKDWNILILDYILRFIYF